MKFVDLRKFIESIPRRTESLRSVWPGLRPYLGELGAVGLVARRGRALPLAAGFSDLVRRDRSIGVVGSGPNASDRVAGARRSCHAVGNGGRLGRLGRQRLFRSPGGRKRLVDGRRRLGGRIDNSYLKSEEVIKPRSE